MRKTGVQQLALASIICLLVLIFAGAVVRVTGSGLGCPDWPTCWGKIIPPTQVDQIDREKLAKDIPRFKKSAERFGRNPDEITVDTLLAEFDGRQTWIEYINRLLATPMALASFLLMIACLRSGRLKKEGIASFVLVILNALFGMVVIASGLHTGAVTVHMALAFALLFVLTYILWAGGDPAHPRKSIPQTTRFQVMVLLACVMIEWAMGSQIREMTDDLMREYGIRSRADWMGQISHSWMFLVHRSFSWSILIATLWLARKVAWQGFVPRLVLAVVAALMLIGVFLSWVGIHPAMQVLHVGLAGVLVTATFYWWLAAEHKGKVGKSA